jgi:thiamine-monophosphate kinase
MFRSEAGFVRWLRRRVSYKAKGVMLGIGDDAALVEVHPGQGVILKADMSIENIHFSRRLHPPRSVGHRALARPLSDLAAMGATPRFALVSLALSRNTPPGWTEGFYAGLLALAARFNLTLVGGDTAVVSGPVLIDVVVTGEVAPGRELRRYGAKPGDQIFVSGQLGLASMGLKLLRARSRHPGPSRRASDSDDRSWAAAVQAHLYPEPRCMLGRYLSAHRLASAAIDLSDGLSTDLGHLCDASSVGAVVWEELLPHTPVSQYSGRKLLSLALHGGEDYQLLFTVPRGKGVPRSVRGLPLCHIGEIRWPRELLLLTRDGREYPLHPGGYDHFRRRA